MKGITCLFLFVVSLFSFQLTFAYDSPEKVNIIGNKKFLNPNSHALSTTIISKEDLDKNPSQSLRDFLDEEVSLNFATAGAPGQIHSTFSRGSEARHTMILIDGIKMNDPSSPSESFNLHNLTLSEIERVEIFHGSQSVLYGSGAIGGVINIVTKDGRNWPGPSSKLSLGVGNYKTSHGTISTSGEKNNISYHLLAGVKQSEGVSAANSNRHVKTTPDPYSRQNFQAKIRYDINTQQSVLFSGHYFKGKSGIDKFVYQQGLQDDPYASIEDKETPFKISFLNTFLNEKIELNIHHLENRTKRKSIEESSYGKYYAKTSETKLENNFYINENNILGLNIGLEKEEAYMKTNYETIPKKKVHTKYTALDYHFDSKVFIAFLGGRALHHELYKDHFTYQITPGFKISQINALLKFGIGKSFKSPNLFQLYSPSYGNKNLRPEKGTSKEIVLEENWNNYHQTKISYFKNEFLDLFDYDRVGPIPRTINISKSMTEGYEIKHKSQITKEHKINLRISYLKKARNLFLNQELLRRSKIKSSLGVHLFSRRQTSYKIGLNYIGKKKDIDEKNNIVEMKPYLLVNGSLQHDINKNSHLNFSIQNILNKKYEEVYGYGTLGRNYYLAYSLDF